MKKPYILITNDDGIHAEGIKHLYRAVKPFAACIIAAPVIQKSGAGLSTTLTKPLHIHKIQWEEGVIAHRITGTPTDCVKLGLKFLLERKPDIIISGINQGSNAGRNVFYSGTIGAVIEGVYKDIPGIAFSSFDLVDPDYEKAEKYIYPIIDYFLKNPLEKDCFLNVNFPSKNFKEFKGIKMASQGQSYHIENPDKRIHPEGHSYYWMGCKHFECEENETSDIYLLNKGYITAVPIKVADLGCKKQIKKHQSNLENIFHNIG